MYGDAFARSYQIFPCFRHATILPRLHREAPLEIPAAQNNHHIAVFEFPVPKALEAYPPAKFDIIVLVNAGRNKALIGFPIIQQEILYSVCIFPHYTPIQLF